MQCCKDHPYCFTPLSINIKNNNIEVDEVYVNYVIKSRTMSN